jgi:hypothetical protein
MEDKERAVEYIFKTARLNMSIFDWLLRIEYAEKIEKEQMIKFAQIVLDNACGDYDGNVVLLKPIEDIYNETYKQQENE